MARPCGIFAPFPASHFRPSLMVKATQSATPTFESALSELESIVHSMESGNAPLEEALAAYEKGVLLLRQCQGLLATAESRLQILEANSVSDLDIDHVSEATKAGE